MTDRDRLRAIAKIVAQVTAQENIKKKLDADLDHLLGEIYRLAARLDTVRPAKKG